jgi:repressor LexA
VIVLKLANSQEMREIDYQAINDFGIPSLVLMENAGIRTVEVIKELLPVVGNVAAGSPILAEQNIEEYLPLPAEFIGSGSHFILRVKGDSMIDAGILDGDYLIVKQQHQANNGEIVVAIIEDEATVKRFYQRDEGIELRPENPAMSPIIVNEARIAGKAAGLIRKF